jgi:hypothetical protein
LAEQGEGGTTALDVDSEFAATNAEDLIDTQPSSSSWLIRPSAPRQRTEARSYPRGECRSRRSPKEAFAPAVQDIIEACLADLGR